MPLSIYFLCLSADSSHQRLSLESGAVVDFDLADQPLNSRSKGKALDFCLLSSFHSSSLPLKFIPSLCFSRLIIVLLRGAKWSKAIRFHHRPFFNMYLRPYKSGLHLKYA
jgi:hypothetical protein